MKQSKIIKLTCVRSFIFTIVFTAVFIISSTIVLAASLSVTPSTAVHATGATFTVRINLNTAGKSVNAAEGTLTFNPRELAVVSANRNGSIFNLWVTEPAFSNSAGTVSFSGGVPSGYTGSAGNIMTVTFRALGSGTARVNFSTASVLANDGAGTNVLTSMNGGTFTINAATPTPEAEQVVVEYVAPANTPAAPRISSVTHPDQNAWYTTNEATLSWDIPSDVTQVRTLLDSSPSSVPTRVYETPIRTITLSDLEEGVSYFHIQFRNADGWGRVAHYRLAVDTQNPTRLEIAKPIDFDTNNPEQQLLLSAEDEVSLVRRFKIQVGESDPFEFIQETASSTVTLPALGSGYHTVTVEAFDEAGNSIIETYTFEIQSFEQPIFTEYPNEINEQVIPVIKGSTRPQATVEITLRKVGAEPATYEVTAGTDGVFTFIPEGRFSTGVYELTARATDQYGAQSLASEVIRIAVQQSGFVRVGSFLVSVLSVIVPLIALTGLSIISSWYVLTYLRGFRKKVRKESVEALDILHREFSNLQVILREQESLVAESRKTKKLTAAEAQMIEAIDRALQSSQKAVEKEMLDVTGLTNSN